MNYDNFDYDHERNTDVNRELSGNSGNENYNVSGAKKRFSAVGFGYMILCVVSVLTANIAALVSAYFFPELSKETWFMLAVSTLPIYAFGLPALWLVIRKEKAEPPAAAERKSPRRRAGAPPLRIARADGPSYTVSPSLL